MDENKISFWKRKEVWGTALTLLSFSPDIINSFTTVGILPEYTLLAKLALPISIVLTALGLRKGYKSDNLPSGITKFMDMIPDKYTGTRGDK